MKKTILSILFAASMLAASAQNVVYDKSGKKHYFKAEDIDLKFQSTLKIEGHQLAPALLAIIPTVVDIGFNLTQAALENNIKKFSAEYTKQKSNDIGIDDKIPSFTLTRNVKLDTKFENALTIHFEPTPVKGLGFVYSIDKIDLNYSAAKATRKSATFDYTIELQVTVLEGKEKKVISLSPIVISSVAFNENKFDVGKHRSDIISLPAPGVITEISVKVVESNPAKVRAEKILALWNDNKDEVKTIINNVLPKEEEKGEKGEKKKDASGGTSNTTTSNTDK